MTTFSSFQTSFDTFDTADWRISDYANQAAFIDTAFVPENVLISPGIVELQLDGQDESGKSYSGAEIRSEVRFFYGRYEVTMQASPDVGTLSSFFLYTGKPFGTSTSEIDFEFLGADTTEVLLTIHTPEGSDGEFVDLGFDAAEGLHTYAFEWAPNYIAWYADDVLLREVESPDISTPDTPGYIFMNVWTGSNAFTGSPSNSVSTTATYSSVSYDPRVEPVAINDRADVGVGGTVDIDVLANDGVMGGTPLPGSVTIDAAPSHGTVSVDPVTGVITYDAEDGYVGFDTFSYTTSDGAYASNSGEVLVAAGIPVFETFTSDAGGFVYSDDAFRGTAEPDYASGVAEGGVIRVTLGGGGLRAPVTDISGGWSRTFDTSAGQEGTLTLRYRIALTEDLDAGEFGEVLVLVDGVEYSVATLEATDSDSEVLDSGFVDVALDLGALSGGTHELTLGGYLNQRTRSNEVATIEFDSVELALSSPSPADDDGNLALTAPDLTIDGAEAGAVTFSVTGIDADATAEVTVSDGTASVSGVLSSDGDLVLDLSSLTDGTLTTSVTATDGDGATATIQGPDLTLVPASGDDDGNLTLTAPDLAIDGSELGAVTFSVTGIDADATAEVTVSDGTASVSGVLSSDGDLVLDLSSLTDGALTTSVTATDAFGSETTVAGPGLTLDSAPPPPTPPTPIDETFTSDAGGFVYSDDAFRGTAEPDYASGVAEGGVIRVTLGGGGLRAPVTDISGGWSRTFDTSAGQEGTLTLRYRIALTEDLDAGEFGEVLVLVDGVEYSVATLEATDSDSEVLDSGFVDVALDLGALSGGTHELTLGGYLNQRTRSNEVATIEFDSVELALSSPSPADDDGNLALTAPDLTIDGAEAGAVTFSVTGIDADATAEVTVSDGTASVSGVLSSDGDLVLDLSSLTDGTLTTSVTATDGDGATATIQGPDLTLVPASGDDDGNLTLTAPDLAIDGSELGAVTFSVTGIDADATAEVTVSDGTASVSGVLSSDGDLVLDLSSLTDGALTTSVTATDAFGSETTVAGPGLTLDSAPPPPTPPTPIDETFTSDAGGFVFSDDAFRGTAEPDYASGVAEGGVIRVTLGGGGLRAPVTDISGGWSRTFDTSAGQEGTLTLRYRIALTEDLDAGEFGEVLVLVDGVEYSVATLEATDSDSEVLDSGFVDVALDLGALSGGTHELTLGGYLNQRTRSNEVATIEFDSVELALSSPSPADDDGNLALTAPDLTIDGAEAGAVTFSVTGIDADATAEVTVSDGTASVSGVLSSDGDLVLDLSSLTDGTLTTSVTATDGDGATATIQGPDLTLVPASGDDDGNLTLTAPDLAIDGSELGAVTFSVTGIDADATAEVTVSDGTASVSGVLSSDGDLVLDLSSLTDGALTTSVTATDAFGSETTVAGPGLTLDSAPPPPTPPTPIDETFTSDAGGFVYSDDAFRGTAEPDYASGVAEGGVIRVTLGGGGLRAPVTDISGGWSRTFDTSAGQEGTLTLRYRIALTEDLDAGEFGEVLVLVDGVEYSVATLEATDSDSEVLDSGFVDVALDLGALSGGTHELTLGGYLNQRTRSNEVATIEFDSVELALSSPSPADDDGNLALTAPDLTIDGAEAGAVTFSVTGIDADATAEVTVSDGTASVSGVLSSDGDLVLDLSSLTDGTLTTSVTATDGDGATATIQGPDLTLVPASGDDDGNLTLTAPDLAIDGSELGAVTFSVTGIDADATAEVTVSDGTASVSGVLSSDGDLVLDLSSLTDGALTTSVTATDAFGSETTVAGPGLTLDSAPPPPVSFSGESRSVSINLEMNSWAYVSKVLPIGWRVVLAGKASLAKPNDSENKADLR